jgi:hypothetical protein
MRTYAERSGMMYYNLYKNELRIFDINSQAAFGGASQNSVKTPFRDFGWIKVTFLP